MKASAKALLCIALSLMLLFTGIGYAAVSDNLSITGVVNASPPEGIYFIASQVSGMSNANSGTISHLSYTSTLESAVNLQAVSSGWWNTTYGSVTYKLTVLNNTAYEYAFSGIDYVASLDGYNGNAYIGKGLTITVTDASGGTFAGDAIAPGEQVICYATYSINSRNLANTDLKTLVNFKFGVNVDSVGAVALDAALIRFGEILNDTSSGGGYETLTSRIDDKYDGANDWKANYIGNVVDAHNDDTETIQQLFGDKLSLTIDGAVTNVTVLIKRENLDGNSKTGDNYTATYNGRSTSASGCEMTLYMTTDTLEKGSPLVYAAVFTCNQNEDGSCGPWYMVGDKYEGTATIVGYEGGQSTGSFDTGTWRTSARKTYSVAEIYSYTVNSNQNIGTIIQANDSNAVSLLQNLITQANDVLSGKYGTYAGTAIIALEQSFANAARCYTVNADGSVTVNAATSRAHAVPLIRELAQALEPFAGIIQ